MDERKITKEEEQFLREAIKNMSFEEQMEMYNQAKNAIALKNKLKLITKLKQNHDITKAMLEVAEKINLENGKWSLVEDRNIIRFKDTNDIYCGIISVESLVDLIIKYFESFNGYNKYKLPDDTFDKLAKNCHQNLSSYVEISIKCSRDSVYKLIHDQVLFESYILETLGKYHRFVTVDGIEYIVYQSLGLSTSDLLDISDYTLKHSTKIL